MNPPVTIQKPIVDSIGDVVEATRALILPYLQSVQPRIETVQYLYGHYVEITNRLQTMSKTEEKDKLRYPLIALMQDIPETVGNLTGNYGTASLALLIVYKTNENDYVPDRYQKVFKPILLPIYHAFLQCLAMSSDFQVQAVKDLRHTKFDRPRWGTSGTNGNTANVFNDILDAVEIRNLVVTVKTTKCRIKSLNKLIH